MTFSERHKPRTVDELVFRDPHVKQVISEYAEGKRAGHLLLAGPAGTAKSRTAQILVNTLCPNTTASFANEPFNAADFEATDFDKITNQWSAQMSLTGASRGWAIIDELDCLSIAKMNQLRSFMDGTAVGTLICTTNNLHVLPKPLQNRFECLQMDLPTADQWVLRAQSILHAEGFHLDDAHVKALLKGFKGSARDLMRWLEDAMLRLQPENVSPMIGKTVASVSNLRVLKGG